MKKLNDWSRKDFEQLPLREWNEDKGPFNSLIIMPSKYNHDSGFKCMEFVACDENKPLYRISGCSDVVNLEGIGGYGKSWIKNGNIPNSIKPVDWSIDCLRKSRLLRIFTSKKIYAGDALSSFELFSEQNNNDIS